jgi:hypothetical protein
LFGLLAMVLAAVFLGASLARRWYRTNTVSTGCLMLATGFVTALAIKVAVVLVDSGLYHGAESPTYQPQSVGVWLGLVVAVTATIALVFVFAGRMASLRAWLLAGLTILTLSAVGATYAWSGLAWWGGPLAPPWSLGGGNGEGGPVLLNTPHTFEGLLYVFNEGHLPATLDGLDLVDVTPGFQIDDTFVLAHCDPATLAGLPRCSEPIAGWVARPGHEASDRSLGVNYRISHTALYRVGWFRIRYHVGPFHFEVFRTDQFMVCGYAPGEPKCHVPGF